MISTFQRTLLVIDIGKEHTERGEGVEFMWAKRKHGKMVILYRPSEEPIPLLYPLLCQHSFYPEDVASKVLQNAGILPHYCLVSQHGRPQLESSSP